MHLFYGVVAVRSLALCLPWGVEGQNFGVVARRDEAFLRSVAGVVEGPRLPFPAAPVGDEEARGAGREGRFSHALRPREQPGVVQPPSGPGFDERLLRGVMADHRSPGSSSARTNGRASCRESVCEYV